MRGIVARDPIIMALIVTFDSDIDELRANTEGCTKCMQVLICDNSEDERRVAEIRAFAESEGVHYLSMGSNRGIGYAQNRGIEYADLNGAEFVLLLDDDSRLTCTALTGLLNAYRMLVTQGERVGVVCARPIDRHGDRQEHTPKLLDAVTLHTEMMSSGSLIPLSVIREVGLMDESLFVDYVDFDWGWKAIAHNYKLYIANDVTFVHALGEGSHSVLGIKLKLKSPIRHYYQTRNIIRLLRRSYVPLRWKITNLIASLARCAAFSVFVAPRRLRLRHTCRGLRDGIAGLITTRSDN